MIVNLGNYYAEIYKKEPASALTDYDYDIGRRFVSTYFNHFDIRDKITNILLMEIIVPDEIITDIRYALMELCDNLGVDNNDLFGYQSITIQIPAYVKCNIGNLNFSRLENGDISMGISYQYGNSIIMELTDRDVTTLYEALDNL